MELLLSGVFMLQVLYSVNGDPTGAPIGACEDMLPSKAPYNLLTEAGRPITGKIEDRS